MLQLLITFFILNLLSLSFPLKLALSVFLIHYLSKFFDFLSNNFNSKLLEKNNRLNLNGKQLILIFLIINLISVIINFIISDINYLDLIHNIASEGASSSNSPGEAGDNSNNKGIVKATKNIADTTFILGAGKLSIEAGKMFPTTVSKSIAMVGTLATLTALKATMSKGFKVSNTSSNNKNNFLADLLENFNTLPSMTAGPMGGGEETFNSSDAVNFPLNLLPELIQFNNIQILFLFLILNIFVAILFQNSNIEFNKYLPQNKFGRIIEYLINRNIKIWSASSKIIFIISWLNLFITCLASKYILALIYAQVYS